MPRTPTRPRTRSTSHPFAKVDHQVTGATDQQLVPSSCHQRSRVLSPQEEELFNAFIVDDEDAWAPAEDTWDPTQDIQVAFADTWVPTQDLVLPRDVIPAQDAISEARNTTQICFVPRSAPEVVMTPSADDKPTPRLELIIDRYTTMAKTGTLLDFPRDALSLFIASCECLYPNVDVTRRGDVIRKAWDRISPKERDAWRELEDFEAQVHRAFYYPPPSNPPPYALPNPDYVSVFRCYQKRQLGWKPGFPAPRPQNQFLLFRNACKQQNALTEYGHGDKVPESERSKNVAKVWRSLSQQERERWVDLAKFEDRMHQAVYPGYKFNPKPRAA